MALTKIPASLLDTSSGFDLQGNITLGDNEKVILGDSSDLQIYHDGSHSRIKDAGAGNLTLNATNLVVNNSADSANMLIAVDGGAVTLYHNGSTKLATSSAGATVTGTLTVTGDLDITGDINSSSVNDLDVVDKTITLGKGQTEANSGGSGIVIDGSGASMLWDESNGEFDFNNPLAINNSIGGDTVLNLTGSYGSGNSVALLGFARSGGAVSGDIKYVDATTDMEMGTGTAHGFSLKTSGTRRLNIDSSGGVGINMNASGYGKLSVNGTGVILALRASSGASRLGFYEAGAGRFYLDTMNGDDGLKFIDGDGSSVRMVIDSSGRVGIGTQNPSNQFVIKNSTNPDMEFGSESGGAFMQIYNRTNSTYGHLRFITNGETMRLSNNGNLGIGYTTPYSRLWVEDEGINLDDFSFEDASSIAHLTIAGSNAHVRMHLGTMDVSPYGVYIQGGYDNSPDNSGTGNAGTEPLLLNPLGHNVGIGTKNPQAILDVSVPNAKTANAGVFAYLGKTNESSNYQALQCFQIGGSAADERRYEFQTIEQGVANNGIICLQKSGGRVFVGTDSADGNNDKFIVAGSIGINMDSYIGAGSGWGGVNSAGSSSTIQLYSSANGNMTFNTNYSTGDTVFNMQSNTKFLIRRWAAGDEAVQFYTPNGGFRVGALNSSYHHTMRISGPSTYYWDNRCEASGGFHTYSDEKLKKEITTITGALDKVAVMNGVTFKWKDADNRGSGDTGKQFGVIAQNMLEVDSELPSLNVDPLAEPGNEETDEKYYSMDYSRITPFLIEAIKELKTKLEAAEARITELEG